MKPLKFLLNQMFNKAKGAMQIDKDTKFSSSSDYKKFSSLVARLDNDQKKSVAEFNNVVDDEDFEEA